MADFCWNGMVEAEFSVLNARPLQMFVRVGASILHLVLSSSRVEASENHL